MKINFLFIYSILLLSLLIVIYVNGNNSSIQKQLFAQLVDNNNNDKIINLHGIINSMIIDLNPYELESGYNLSGTQKFLLSGDWNILYPENGKEVHHFQAQFLAISADGKGAHIHEISGNTGDLVLVANNSYTHVNNDGTSPSIIDDARFVEDDKNYTEISFEGNTNVAINGQTIWEDVPTIITIHDNKTISIMLKEEEVDFHFGVGQPIYGLVNPT